MVDSLVLVYFVIYCIDTKVSFRLWTSVCSLFLKIRMGKKNYKKRPLLWQHKKVHAVCCSYRRILLFLV